ncbi:MAG: HAD family phosphatase [Chloroflexi bacterium]|nr:HAD family phosphatase [Chloroflexota bacterium]
MKQPALAGIIFDFGGVFTKTRRRDQILHRCEDNLGLARGTLLELLFAGEHWLAVSTGKISAEQYWQAIGKALNGTVPAELEPFRYNPFAYEELNQKMVALGRRLHQRYTIALLSNATPYLEVLLARYGLGDVFDVVVNSARVGMRKPDAGIYQLTLDKMGMSAEQCLFVDDKERNTAVAEALGMKALVFRSAAYLERQLKGLGIF